MKILLQSTLPYLCLACFWSATGCAGEFGQVELMSWRMLGIGSVEIEPEGLSVKLTEGPDSNGVVLLSPTTYGQHIVVDFQVKPLVHESICVVFLSASAVDGTEIQPAENYDGNFDYWRGPDAEVRSYTFAFHTSYHQPYAFLIINPGPVELDKQLDKATDQKWYHVQYGRDGAKIWLKVDGKVLLRAEDPNGEGLPDGHIGFRVRGPGDGSASVLYRNVSVRGLN